MAHQPRGTVGGQPAHLQIIDDLSRTIESWSSAKNSFITLERYADELTTWMDLAGERRPERVCSIGCGAGFYLLSGHVLGAYERCIGIDPCIPSDGTSPEELEETIEFVNRWDLGAHVQFRRGRFPEQMPEGNFELVIFRDSLHHVYPAGSDSRQRCITDLSRLRAHMTNDATMHILEPSRPGRLYGATYNFVRSKLLKGKPIKWTAKRRLADWKDILRRAGFVDITARKVPVGAFLNLPGGRELGTMLSNQYVIAARLRGV